MTGSDELRFAIGQFEPCTGFTAADEVDVCSACGWLAEDHDPSEADVVALPRRAPVTPTPARKAS